MGQSQHFGELKTDLTNPEQPTMKTFFFAIIVTTVAACLEQAYAQWNTNACDFANVVGYYPFLGSARNQGGSGLNGTAFGADLTADRFGNAFSAYHFNGSGDNVSCGNSLKPTFPFTISMWIKQHSNDRRVGLFSSGAWASRYYGVQIVLLPLSGSVYVSVGNGGSAVSGSRKEKYTTGTNGVPVGGWHHIAVVCTNINGWDIFIDGTLRPTTWEITGTGNSLVHDSANTFFGWSNSGGGPNQYFDGIIDDLIVYDRALSATEVLGLFNSPNPELIDSDSDGYNNREEVLAGMSPCDSQEHPAAHHSKHQRVRLDVAPAAVTNFMLHSSTNLGGWAEVPRPYEGTASTVYLPFDPNGSEFFRATLATNILISRALRVAFPTLSGTNYQVQYSSNTLDWVNVSSPILGTGSTGSAYAPQSFDSYFFRVINP